MHTAGLVDFLGRDGYDVRHFFARYSGWGIGRVDGDGYLRGSGDSETFGRADGGVGDPRRTGGSEAIEFAEGEWSVPTIRDRFRAAVDSFGPDGSWLGHAPKALVLFGVDALYESRDVGDGPVGILCLELGGK